MLWKVLVTKTLMFVSLLSFKSQQSIFFTIVTFFALCLKMKILRENVISCKVLGKNKLGWASSSHFQTTSRASSLQLVVQQLFWLTFSGKKLFQTQLIKKTQRCHFSGATQKLRMKKVRKSCFLRLKCLCHVGYNCFTFFFIAECFQIRSFFHWDCLCGAIDSNSFFYLALQSKWISLPVWLIDKTLM